RSAHASSVTPSTDVRASPAPGRSKASAEWPACANPAITASHSQAPPYAPWTRTNLAIAPRIMTRDDAGVGATYTNPVFDGAFPDPMAALTGSDCYAYATGDRFPILH